MRSARRCPRRRCDGLTYPVVVNASARATQEPDELRHELAVQVYSAVRWTETLERLAELGCDRFLEVGPGTVLAGLVRRTLPDSAGRQLRGGLRFARGVFAPGGRTILKRFDGKVALVTGASRGIGRAIALRLAAEGANIVVNYNAQVEAANEVAEEAESFGSDVAVVQANVARHADVDRLVQAALDRFKRIDVLINNAGITRDTLIMRMSEDDWDAVLDTNLKSAFLVTKAVLRPMLKQRSGRIVNITSISGVMGNAGQANYSASKAGMIGLTRSTAREVASRSITCNAVAAGVIDTDIWQGVPEAMIEAMLQLIPAGRKGTPGRHCRSRCLSGQRRRQLHHRPGPQRRWRHGHGLSAMPLFNKVLIANRGEIAVRIIPGVQRNGH